jgi:hypothetical protein
MRAQFAHLVNDEKHDVDELTIDGGWQPRDASGRVEEWGSHDKT